jgi:hypothetical protein
MADRIIADTIFKESVTIELAAQPITTSVTVNYHTLNGNSPLDSRNYIGFWKASDTIIPIKKADCAYLMNNTSDDSSFTMPNVRLQDSAYIVGYCQTAEDPSVSLVAANNVSACDFIEKVHANTVVTKIVTLDVTDDSSNTLLFYTLLGNMSYANNWFGVWGEDSSIINDDPTNLPIYTAPVPSADPNKIREIVLSGSQVPWTRGGRFKIAYFANGYNTDKSKCNVTNMMSIIHFSF